MCTPMSCSSAAYSSHSRSRSVSPCTARRLVEQRQREPDHLLSVLGVVVAAFGQFDRAAPPHVGNPVDLSDLPAVAVDVVEDQAFAERQVAERELFGAEPAQDRVEEHGAGDDQIGAPRIEAGHGEALLEVERDDLFAEPRICLADTRRLRSSAGGAPRASVAATAPRLRIVPDVPITRSKPIEVICSQCRSISARMCFEQLALVVLRERIALGRTARSAGSRRS